MLRWIQNSRGYLLRHAAYEAQLCLSEGPMRVELAFDGREMAELALVSVLDTPDEKERLTDVAIQRLDEEGDALTLLLTARSSLWQSRRFEWRFEQGRVTYRHFASGDAPLGRCFFFSNGQPGIYDPGDSVGGYHANASFLTPVYHTFNPNLANVTEFDISQPGFAGVGRSEAVRHADYVNIERHNGIFSPGPLCFAFRHADAVMGLGLGCKPGAYQFNGLEYSGCMKYAASFHVQYLGYTRVSGGYESPEIALTFGYSPFECLTRYISWIDERGYGTSFRFPAAPWHRQPIFCGWAEQSALCPLTSTPAAQATQANYEAWAAELDARGVPYGTLVVDDKWQKHYGTFEVDREKWPDMPGFVRRQHEKGRHVLLWIPGYQAEGVPEAFCAKDESGKPLFATPGLPAYDAFIREGVTRLIQETDADGFKEDWIGRTGGTPGIRDYGPQHGIELIRRFQFVVHDALHAVKPDGLMETQTPHPLLRESSDMLRLNDIWFSTRELSEMMRERARIARIAGWELLDCDNASPTVIREWLQYAQVQPKIGIPSLYFLTETESSHERMTRAQSDFLCSIWRDYIERNAL